MKRALVAVVVALLTVVAPATAAHASGDNVAVAVNTDDGASVFRLAFSIKRVADSVVDNGNGAVAYASCTDCQTVALAFQVVLVRSDVDVFTPENVAIAENVDCTACTTYASATQIVLPIEGPAVLTQEGQQRLHDLYKSLQDLEKSDAPIDVDTLNATVQAANAELLSIFTEELRPVGQQADQSSTTTTSTTGSSTTTTTTRSESTSTSTTVSSTTTTVVDGSTTTTTESSTSSSTTTP